MHISLVFNNTVVKHSGRKLTLYLSTITALEDDLQDICTESRRKPLSANTENIH